MVWHQDTNVTERTTKHIKSVLNLTHLNFVAGLETDCTESLCAAGVKLNQKYNDYQKPFRWWKLLGNKQEAQTLAQ